MRRRVEVVERIPVAAGGIAVHGDAARPQRRVGARRFSYNASEWPFVIASGRGKGRGGEGVEGVGGRCCRGDLHGSGHRSVFQLARWGGLPLV
jgi:hypothetical protein